MVRDTPGRLDRGAMRLAVREVVLLDSVLWLAVTVGRGEEAFVPYTTDVEETIAKRRMH